MLIYEHIDDPVETLAKWKAWLVTTQMHMTTYKIQFTTVHIVICEDMECWACKQGYKVG